LIPLHLAGAYSAALPTTYGIQPIYYQQQPTTTLLATTTNPQTLSTLIPNQTITTTLNGSIHGTQNQSTGTPSYYELTYATTPTIDQSSYIYAAAAAAAASGQTFSYAQLSTATNQQQTGSTNINDIYANHTGKYIIDDHNGSGDRDHHQRTSAGW
ncbi:unnamed protein product, partial [Rotaria sp. Silwood1]